jgi:transcription termination factor NusB
MDRRSWYMPKESADALAAAIEELHYTERAPKHVVVAALVEVALDHLDDVRRHIQGR